DGGESDVLTAGVDGVLDGLAPPLERPVVVVLQRGDEELGADRDDPALGLLTQRGRAPVWLGRYLDGHRAAVVVVDLAAEDGVAALDDGHHREVGSRPRVHDVEARGRVQRLLGGLEDGGLDCPERARFRDLTRPGEDARGNPDSVAPPHRGLRGSRNLDANLTNPRARVAAAFASP